MTVLAALSAIVFTIFVLTLAIYLILIDSRLRVISQYLGKIAFGVRAVESQTSPIGPATQRINADLQEIDASLRPIAEKARRLA